MTNELNANMPAMQRVTVIGGARLLAGSGTSIECDAKLIAISDALNECDSRFAAAIRVKRIEGDVELVPPEDCHVSVLLKLVHRNMGHRHYAWWAVAGRFDMDAISLRYTYTGEDTIQLDLPRGTPLSAAILERSLVRFLTEQGELEGEKPKLTES